MSKVKATIKPDWGKQIELTPALKRSINRILHACDIIDGACRDGGMCIGARNDIEGEVDAIREELDAKPGERK